MTPWPSIFMFIISFLYQKSRGKSTAAAALTGAAVGLGTYFLADPANPNNLFGIGVDSSATSGAGAKVTMPGTSKTPSTVADVLGTTVTTTGEVLKNWGAKGTAAVVGTTAVATSDTLKKWLPWILVGGGLILLTK